MSEPRLPWFLGSKMLLSWGDVDDPQGETGLFDPLTQTYVNAGTAQVDSIVDEGTGTSVAGLTFPLAMTYLSGSRGIWYVRTPGTEVLTRDQLLKAKLFGAATGGAQLARYLRFTVVEG